MGYVNCIGARSRPDDIEQPAGLSNCVRTKYPELVEPLKKEHVRKIYIPYTPSERFEAWAEEARKKR